MSVHKKQTAKKENKAMKYIPGKKLFHRIQRQYPKNDPRVILETKKQITAQYRKVDRDMAPLLMKRLRKLKQHGLYNQNIMLPLLISVLMGIFGSAVVNLIEKIPQGPPLVSLLVSLLVLPLFICPTLAILLWMILAYGRSTAYSEYELYIRPFECKLLENRIRQLTKMDLSSSPRGPIPIFVVRRCKASGSKRRNPPRSRRNGRHRISRLSGFYNTTDPVSCILNLHTKR